MLHGVLCSLGEHSYRQGLFSLHENSKLNLPVTRLCTNSTRCTSHYKPKGSTDRGKNVPETHQSLARGSKVLLWVRRALHTHYCPCLILRFPNLPENINLVERSTVTSGCCWQSAPGWCLQVLSLPFRTCSNGSDLPVT